MVRIWYIDGMQMVWAVCMVRRWYIDGTNKSYHTRVVTKKLIFRGDALFTPPGPGPGGRSRIEMIYNFFFFFREKDFLLKGFLNKILGLCSQIFDDVA